MGVGRALERRRLWRLATTLVAATLVMTALDGGRPAHGSTAGAGLGSLVPARLLETRSGPGLITIDGVAQGTGRVIADTTIQVAVSGRGGVPGNADAVMLNITVVNPAGPGFVTVYPCGQPRPTTSTVNFTAGAVVANSAFAKLGTNGTVCIYTLTTTDLVVDVTGQAGSGTGLGPLVPARLLETRSGPGLITIDGVAQGTGRVIADTTIQVAVTGPRRCARQRRRGDAQHHRCQPRRARLRDRLPVRPTPTHHLDRQLHRRRRRRQLRRSPNSAPTAPSASTPSPQPTSSSTSPAQAGSGAGLGSLVPARLLETRSGPGLITIDGVAQGTGRVIADTTIEVAVSGRGGVPGNADAVMLNITVVNPAGPGFVTVYPCGQPRPTTSTVNFTAGAVVANSAFAKLGTNGTVCIYTLTTTDLVVDVTGQAGGPSVVGTTLPAVYAIQIAGAVYSVDALGNLTSYNEPFNLTAALVVAPTPEPVNSWLPCF